MNILSTVEAAGAAGTNAVVAEGLDGFFFEGLVRVEVVEIVGGKIGNSSAIG